MFTRLPSRKTFDAHKCNDSEDEVFSKKKKKQVKSSKIGKDITHYLHRQDMKGGKDEVDGKIEQLKRILIKANENPKFRRKHVVSGQKAQNIHNES